MSDAPQTQPPGWYYAQGDPPGTQRYWDGMSWQGGPQPVPGVAGGAMADSTSTTNAGAKLADPGKRVLARLIDTVIWIVLLVLIPLSLGTGPLTDTSFSAAFVLGIVTGALVVAYEAVMVGQFGATLGKQALGLQVVNQDGSKADFVTGLKRMILYAVFIFIGMIPVLGLFAFVGVAIGGLAMMITDGKTRQTPWDKIGQTLVVEA